MKHLGSSSTFLFSSWQPGKMFRAKPSVARGRNNCWVISGSIQLACFLSIWFLAKQRSRVMKASLRILSLVTHQKDGLFLKGSIYEVMSVKHKETERKAKYSATCSNAVPFGYHTFFEKNSWSFSNYYVITSNLPASDEFKTCFLICCIRQELWRS